VAIDLFRGDIRWSDTRSVAERVFTTWRSIPGCRPGWDSESRARVVRLRIVEALDDGWNIEVILAALDRAWNFKAPRVDGGSAFETALAMAHREENKVSEPQMTSTQAAILRVRDAANRTP
jgi:hypothetical protein